LCLVYSLENCVDFLSSIVVLWRFFALSKLDDVLEEKLKRREKRASIAVSFILALLGLSILATAIDDLSRGQEVPDQLKGVVVVAFLSIFIFGILSIFKFRYATILESPSLYKDGICSLIGAVLAGALFINTLIIDRSPGVWWIDPLVSFGAGTAAIVIGARAVWAARYEEQLPIFNVSWWMLSQGEDGNGNSTEIPRTNNNDEDEESNARYELSDK
jgi:divalent metal cation (Fe/Co/Zn/Cd) transporter